MPQPFNNAVITNGGARLLTRAQAGELKIEIARIVVGSGDYTEDEKTLSFLQQQENLKAPKNSYGISDLEVYSDHSVKVAAVITNYDPGTGQTLVNEGYYINEMGLFAKEKGGGPETEVLYSIAVTSGNNGDFMPPYNGYNPAQIIQDYFVTVNNSSEVRISTGNSALALAEDVQEIRNILSGLFSVKDETLLLTRGHPKWSIGSVGEGSALPIATANQPGVVMIGQGIDVDGSGKISTDVEENAKKAADIVEERTECFSPDEISGLFK